MRILVVHNRYQQMGGEDVVFETETRALQDAGHVVERFVLDNASIRSLSDKIRAAINVSHNTASIAKFQRALSDFKPDIVHVHNFFPLLTPGALAAAAEARLPVIQTLHNYRALCANGLFFRDGKVCRACTSSSYLAGGIHRCYRGSAVGSLAVGRMGRNLREIALRHSQFITFVAMTNFSKSRFVEGGFDEQQIVIKNHAIPDPGEGDQVRQRKILFAGRLSPEKGADLLCRLASRIDAEFVIIGGGPEFDTLSHNKPKNLSLLGPMSREELFGHMKSAAAVVVPSRWYETGPLTVLEAFATGTPVIASNLGTPAELVTDGVTGLLAGPEDDLAWEHAVMTILSDSAFARQIGQNGRAAYLERFTENANILRLIQIYSLAIERAKTTFHPEGTKARSESDTVLQYLRHPL